MRESCLNSLYTRKYIKNEIARLKADIKVITKALSGVKRVGITAEFVASKNRRLEGFMELLEQMGDGDGV